MFNFWINVPNYRPSIVCRAPRTDRSILVAARWHEDHAQRQGRLSAMLQEGIEMDLPDSQGLALTAEQEWETFFVYSERVHRWCSRVRELMPLRLKLVLQAEQAG